MNKKSFKRHERGQAIILIAFAMVGLIAMVGLVTDTGILLIEYGKLKRAVDAAAIAAAQQFSLPSDEISEQAFEDSAINFLNLNETREITSLSVKSCLATLPADRPELCNDYPVTHPEDNRKLVEVTASATVNFSFLSVIGIRSTTITTTAIGEAATLDVVLVIDTSASMAYETRDDPIPYPQSNYASDNSDYRRYDADLTGYTSENPQTCNTSITDPCQPLDAVKEAAIAFSETLNYGYDRVAIVSLTGQETSNGTRYPTTVLPLSSNKTTVQAAINSLRVFTPRVCDNNATFANVADGVCIHLLNTSNPSTFQSVKCHYYELRTLGGFFPKYPSCPSSNVGGALRLAGSALSGNDRRLDSFWVVLVLLSGPANATDTPSNYPGGISPGNNNEYIYGYCPASEYYPVSSTDTDNNQVYDYRPCTDGLPNVRHSTSDTMFFTYNGSTDEISLYDPDDYARDRADALANLLSGSGVTIYTIGLGTEVKSTDRQADTSVPIAESLLQYIALEAGGADVNHGQYFYTPVFQDLVNIFEKIAENIATKISQ